MLPCWRLGGISRLEFSTTDACLQCSLRGSANELCTAGRLHPDIASRLMLALGEKSIGDLRSYSAGARSRNTMHDGLPTGTYWPVKLSPPVRESTSNTAI